MRTVLLDHRYSVSSLLSATPQSRRFAGYHVGLDAPVRIVELRQPGALGTLPRWDVEHVVTLAARAATLNYPALPRVRDCFCAPEGCYIIEDARDGEPLANWLARGPQDLRIALRDGLQLCDAVAHLAYQAPDLLPCLPISGATLAYDATDCLRLTTWDYQWMLGGERSLDPGVPDLRAPELHVDGQRAPDERSHVYSIAALLAILLTGSTNLSATLAAGVLPATVWAALEPALCADRHQRTPTADALGQALASAARASLPVLAYLPALVNRPALVEEQIEHVPAHHSRSMTLRSRYRSAVQFLAQTKFTVSHALRRAGERVWEATAAGWRREEELPGRARHA
jgi:hypothetical protein